MQGGFVPAFFAAWGVSRDSPHSRYFPLAFSHHYSMQTRSLVLSSIIVAALIALAPEGFGQGAGGPAGKVLREDGVWVGIDEDPETFLGGTFGNPMGRAAPPLVGAMGPSGMILKFDIPYVPGSPWAESYLLGIPRTPLVPAPVLVLFHAYGQTEKSLFEDTSFFRLAMERGWIVVAPLGAHTKNFGIEYSQVNVKAALDQVATVQATAFSYTVDTGRYYAIGFSMGAGAAASFSARHCDTDDGLHFAATAVHTGPTSLPYSYAMDSATRDVLIDPEMFGGPPTDPLLTFDYLRCSSLDIDPVSKAIDPTTDMIRNLQSTLLFSHYVLGGKPVYDHLLDQTNWTQAWHAMSGSPTLTWVEHSPLHDWSTLRQEALLRVLDKQVFTAPAHTTYVPVLADRDGGWHAFDLEQTVGRAFSPFEWYVDPSAALGGNNALRLEKIDNIASLSLAQPTGLGFEIAPSVDFHCYVKTSKKVGLDVVLGEFPNPPVDVRRNNKSTTNYIHDSVAETLTLQEKTGSTVGVTWTIKP